MTTSEADRIRAHTAAEVLRQIDDVTNASLVKHASASAQEVKSRLDELDREWDTDRVLETQAAGLGLLGLALGLLVRPSLLVLPALVAGSVLFQAKTGRYPLMPLLRRLGYRTSREIARERYALKALRGDFIAMEQVSAKEKLAVMEKPIGVAEQKAPDSTELH